MKKLYGVIGDPIAHSMSPVMHNDLFSFYNIDAHYFPFKVSERNLRETVLGFKAIGAGGFNVTIPHKTRVMDCLDRIDPLAESIGAVNTVVAENGELTGYNTDGPGFVRGLEEQLSDLTGKKTLIIGAGGAAKGIYYSLAKAGVNEIDICNRTLIKAEEMASACPFDVNSTILEPNSAELKMGEYELVIQTTSIGMSPKTGVTPLSLDRLQPGSFVSDIIYNPSATAFLAEAISKGAGVQNGLDMFVYQGALAFEKWTGIFPDTVRMKNNVMNQLGGPSC
ncbi:shikimate dehydrogenase [Mesobacillus zeae]|uniref:Shikimate dehydrogenase (NADP(+)) n=1 Tax=Mesobacillus zeae TaxID=1917180 RepID=A0A398B7T0_9BACI|nr:shikimate dehydrogenase [Mesobacillus zeae]RID83773.1 shikimate dehydrogenase [Mesobacillus zeae]